jgi:hypothetical protein
MEKIKEYVPMYKKNLKEASFSVPYFPLTEDLPKIGEKRKTSVVTLAVGYTYYDPKKPSEYFTMVDFILPPDMGTGIRVISKEHGEISHKKLKVKMFKKNYQSKPEESFFTDYIPKDLDVQ